MRLALTICGCSPALIDSIINDSVDKIDYLRRLTNSDIFSLICTISSAMVARGDAKFGIIRVKKV